MTAERIALAPNVTAKEWSARMLVTHSIRFHAPVCFEPEVQATHSASTFAGAMTTPTLASVVALATNTFDAIDDAAAYLRTGKAFLGGQTPLWR
jgi:hypothetical protein